jgi:hypothetical protein
MSPRDMRPERDSGEDKPRSKRSQRVERKPRKQPWQDLEKEPASRKRKGPKPVPLHDEWDDEDLTDDLDLDDDMLPEEDDDAFQDEGDSDESTVDPDDSF